MLTLNHVCCRIPDTIQQKASLMLHDRSSDSNSPLKLPLSGLSDSQTVWLFRILVLTTLYLVSARFGFILAIPPGNVTAVWPPSGITLAALLIWGNRLMPGVWLGAFLANTLVFRGMETQMMDITLAALIATGSLLQAWAGAFLSRRIFPDVIAFASPEQVFRFLLLAILMCLVSSSIGVLSLGLGARIDWSAFGGTWLTWWLGDLVGILIVTPLLLSVLLPAPVNQQRSVTETLALFGSLMLTGQLLFGIWNETNQMHLDFVVFPSLIWAATRFNLRFVMLAIASMAGMAIWGTANGIGPFIENGSYNSMITVQFYVGIVTLTTLLLYASVVVRQRTEVELRQSEIRWRQIFETEPECVKRLDKTGALLQMNPAGLNIIEADTFDEVKNQCVYPLIAPEYRDQFRKLTERVFQGESGTLEFKLVGLKGAVRWLETHATPLLDEQGKVSSLLAITRDITEKRRAELDLRMTQFASDHVSDAVFWVGPDAKILYVNDAAVSRLGYSREELLNMYVFEFDPDYQAELWPGHWEDLRQRGTMVFESRHRARDGHMIDVEINANFVCFGNEEFNFAFSRDITSRKQTVAALKESEQRLSYSLEATQEGLWDWTIASGKVHYSPQWLRLLGYDRGEVPDRVEFFFSIIHPDDVEIIQSTLEDHLQGRTPVNQTEIRLRLKSGEYHWFYDRGKVVAWDEFGQPQRMVGTINDITDRKRSEAALRESELLFRAVFDGSPILISLISYPEGRLVELNSTALAAFGYTREEALGRTLLEIGMMVNPLDRERGMEELIRMGACHNLELPMRRKNGEIFIALYNGSLVTIGDKTYTLNTVQDITTLRKAEAEKAALQKRISESQKLEALGTLASGIAHDFNNILGAIMGHTQLAQIVAGNNQSVQDNLEQISNASLRASALIKQILTLSRRQVQERKPTDLRLVITEALQLLRSTLPSSIEIISELQADIGPVMADATQIHQVVLNLCTNAVHAIGLRPGKIEVRLFPMEIDAIQLQSLPELRQGQYVVLSISDTGYGINADIINQIFDPFFTTKSPGEGTGQGLTVVQGIVKDHEGLINVHSQPGLGTEFRIYFPVVAMAAEEPSIKSQSLPHGQGERIMFVDDEIALCSVARMLLNRLNYVVTTYTDPRRALHDFRSQPDLWDLVITDLSMPGMSGMTLATEMLRLRPGLRVILTSGYSGIWTTDKVKAQGVTCLIPKPYTLESLSEILHTTLQPEESSLL